MKIKTSELIGTPLDWAVYICHWGGDVSRYGDDFLKYKGYIGDNDSLWSPSTNWGDGGPVIEREKIWAKERYGDVWDAYKKVPYSPRDIWKGTMIITGRTYLEAAMRCYITSKLGEEVDVPDELSP